MGNAAEKLEEPEDNTQEAANEDQKPTRLEQLMEQDPDELIKKGKSFLTEYDQLEADRKEINADCQSIREQAAAMGIPKEAFDLARKVAKMSDDKRDGFWLALQIMLKAAGAPVKKSEVQMELFA